MISIKFNKIKKDKTKVFRLLKFLHQKQKYELKQKGFHFNLLYQKFYITQNDYFNYHEVLNDVISCLEKSNCLRIKDNIEEYREMFKLIQKQLKNDNNLLSDVNRTSQLHRK